MFQVLQFKFKCYIGNNVTILTLCRLAGRGLGSGYGSWGCTCGLQGGGGGGGLCNGGGGGAGGPPLHRGHREDWSGRACGVLRCCAHDVLHWDTAWFLSLQKQLPFIYRCTDGQFYCSSREF